MQEFAATFGHSIGLILSGDAQLWAVVLLSLKVSLTAVFVSALIGLPLGAWLAVSRFTGRQSVIVLINALMGLPPVVVGLMVYLMLSNNGPLGVLQLLYTPTAMIIAQTVLVVPIVGLSTALLAGFGRAIAEVGAVIIVGGNINHVTRVMTTSIALETSRGNLALALALGTILVLTAIMVNGAVTVLGTVGRQVGNV